MEGEACPVDVASLASQAVSSEQRAAVLSQFSEFASSWTSEEHLLALARALALFPVSPAEDGPANARALCSVVARLAGRGFRSVMAALFGADAVRGAVLQCVERNDDVEARRDASGALAKLCLFCLRDPPSDRVVSSFVRFLLVPLSRALSLEPRLSDPQTVANVSQIVAARLSSQSHDKTRKPDEAVLFAEAGLFDALGPHLATSALVGPVMNALRGLLFVGPEALEHIQHKGVLVENLKKIGNKEASAIIDAIELGAFKRHVRERSKEDGGKALGNDFLGVVGAAEGPKAFGFEFTNKEIEKGFKDRAFKEGVLRPMAAKMEEEGEAPLNVDNIAKTVLNDFTAPKPGCEVCTNEGTKRCGNCKKAHYCSEEHQKQDWPKHKPNCKKV